ncbi:molybdenum cofactor guanylyltransferase [Sandarakinorhabdus oryzae]|uniref:molybdenum cofactor guanylyltransferase n=1 Tax=Sandarakinorhabdus oryzae TaxID=2675220 RepID=UPI0012E0FDFF|nr:molybdenum cofactor guanylyltransferase [Sandarakinorhabdus oryzae]
MMLGAVLAGGESRRFGSDKALALLDGQTLLARAIERLRVCDELVVAGRDVPGITSLADWPAPGLGPLGGLAAAMRHLRRAGCAHLVSLPVDVEGLPDDWLERLFIGGTGSVCAMGQPLVGVWAVRDWPRLEGFIEGGGRRVRDWVRQCQALEIDLGPLININTRDDLAGLGG